MTVKFGSMTICVMLNVFITELPLKVELSSNSFYNFEMSLWSLCKTQYCVVDVFTELRYIYFFVKVT